MELKGSKTEANLKAAFAGESEARNKYSYFASTAKRKAMSRYPLFFWRQPTMRKNTPRKSLNF
jgi:rubrerythrin